MNMPLSPTWTDIAVRLILTMFAGALIGINRGAGGHAAGFRTTILVALAAAVAMIQANILLPLAGKTPESFGQLDLMRLPLGILTGVGFIGGGAILKRGQLVTGVTTAATLWIVTVIGLCFGGGQLLLGIAAMALALLTLWALKYVDILLPRSQRAKVAIIAETAAIPDLASAMKPAGYEAQFRSQNRIAETGHFSNVFVISWKASETGQPPRELTEILTKNFSVESLAMILETRD